MRIPSALRSRFILASALAFSAVCYTSLSSAVARAEDPTASVPKPTVGGNLAQAGPAIPKALEQRIGARIPVLFEANEGQAPAGILYTVRTRNLQMLLRKDRITILRMVPNPGTGAQRRAGAGAAGAQPKASPQAGFSVTQETVEFVGANPDVSIEPLEKQDVKVNYFVGRDPSHWLTHVASYARVLYHNIYPGIDLVFYGNHGELEYDFTAAAGANPGQIRLKIDNREPYEITEGGVLQLGTGNDAILHRPFLYQNVNNRKKAVSGQFVRVADQVVGFRFADYDHSKTFIIDPAINLLYSTYVGGVDDDEAYGMTLDAASNTYIVGFSPSQNFPVTANAYSPVDPEAGIYYAVVMKFDASGNLLYSTGLGGEGSGAFGQANYGYAIAVDSSGDAWVGGATSTTDFPVTTAALQSTSTGTQDAFLSELSPDGSSLLYSTYFGGTGANFINAMVMNTDGSLWMAGGSSAGGLAVTANGVQTTPKGTDNYFVAKVVPGSGGTVQIPYLTYIGGSNASESVPISAGGGALATDSAGNVYLAGMTFSGDYPVSSNAYEKPFPLAGGCGGGPTPNSVATLTKFSPNLSQMLYSTVIGGKTESNAGGTEPDCNQAAVSIHLDAQNNIWLTGTTGESDFPVSSNALFSQLNTNGSAGVDYFLFELSADGSTELYGSYFGNSNFNYGDRAAWDSNNNIWIVGNSNSTNFPVTSNALQSSNASTNAGGTNISEGYNVTLTELNPTATQILYSTYFGGSGSDCTDGNCQIAIDRAGNIHLAGGTTSANFPVTPDALQPLIADGGQRYNNTGDMFYSVLGTGVVGTVGPSSAGNTGDVTVTIGGAGFESGATCSLVMNGTTVQSIASVVNAAGTQIICSFALDGATPGSYTVQVANPNGGGTFSSNNPFNVTSGGQPNLWVNIVGRSLIRYGVPSTVTVNYGNSGSVDAYLVGLKVALPPTISASYNMGVVGNAAMAAPATTAAPAAMAVPATAAALATTANTTASGSVIPMFIPHLAAGQSGSFNMTIVDNTDNDKYTLSATIGHAWYTSSQAATTDLTAQSQHYSPSTTCQPSLAQTPTVSSCLAEFLSTLATTDGLTPAQLQSVAANFLFMLQQSQAGPTPLIGGTTSQLATLQFETGTLVVNWVSSNDNYVLFHVTDTSQQYLLPTAGNCVRALDNIGDSIGDGYFETCTFNNVSAPVINGVTFAGQSMLIGLSGGVWGVPDYCFTTTQNVQPTTFNVTAYTGLCTGNILGAPTQPSADANDDDDSDNDEPIPPDYDPTIPENGSSTASTNGSTGSSVDPNGKSGTLGDMSSNQYVNWMAALPYEIYFENQPTATLPAAQVVVTDQLDPTKVNLSSLTLGAFNFGNTSLQPPPGVNNYSTLYNINSSLSVRIQGSLNPQTGLLKWTFSSIDPSTGLPPSDPTVGFLPPDTDGIEGQGSVLFMAQPVAGQTTGTKITNNATVVFDANASINTDTWTNTLDVTAPASSVAALPATTTQTSFTVSWSGTDAGSGVASYNIYSSTNGGAFTLWQSAVTASSATFTGTVGNTYGFLSQATDKVGNVEALRTTADTSTEIVTSLPPDFSIGSTAPSASISPGGSAMFTLNVTPVNGFNGAVSFACSGLPSEATCSFSPTTVTPNGAASSTTMTIATTASSGQALLINPWSLGGPLAACVLFPFFFRRRRSAWILLLVCATCLAIGSIGCGGGGGGNNTSTGPTNPGTPAGSSTITVTATSGSGSSALTHTTTVTLTVQ